MNRISGALALRAMRSAWLCRALFGVRVLPLAAGDRYFDTATLALRHVLSRGTWKVRRVLEVGTGSSALLARWLSLRGWQVCATELDEVVAGRAQACVESTAPGSVDMRCGSFFADISEPLDLVVFNPPFVPSPVGLARGLATELRMQWDGGEDGCAVLRGFLAVFAARETQAQALLAINTRHVSTQLVERCIAACSNLRLVEWHPAPWTTARVARIARVDCDQESLVNRKSPIARTSSPLE